MKPIKYHSEEEAKYANTLDDFKIVCEIGNGSFGSVYKVVHKITKLLYVIKKVSLGHLSPTLQQEALIEVKMLKELKHSNIIQYHTCFIQNHQLYIVTECAEKGDIQKV